MQWHIGSLTGASRFHHFHVMGVAAPPPPPIIFHAQFNILVLTYEVLYIWDPGIWKRISSNPSGLRTLFHWGGSSLGSSSHWASLGIRGKAALLAAPLLWRAAHLARFLMAFRQALIGFLLPWSIWWCPMHLRIWILWFWILVCNFGLDFGFFWIWSVLSLNKCLLMSFKDINAPFNWLLLCSYFFMISASRLWMTLGCKRRRGVNK